MRISYCKFDPLFFTTILINEARYLWCRLPHKPFSFTTTEPYIYLWFCIHHSSYASSLRVHTVYGPMRLLNMAASITPICSSTLYSRVFQPCCRAKFRAYRKSGIQRRHFHPTDTSYAATVISGTELARQIHREIQRDVENWVSHGNKRPHLSVIRVGNDPASRSYVRNKTKAATALGICSETLVRPASMSQEELLEMIDTLNRDWRVSGLLVQLPLPGHINERAVCNAIAPEKDVDGFHIVNIGKLCLDQRSMVPATPAAVWEIIRRTGIQTVGRNVLVAGRSKNVGMPIAMLLHTDRRHERPGGDATVTIAHRCTPKEQLKELTCLADIIIAAAGVPNLITADMVKPGAAVIDVGISRIQDQTGKVRLIGDVDFEEVKMKAGFITPVPGGVGPMTVAMTHEVRHNTMLCCYKCQAETRHGTEHSLNQERTEQAPPLADMHPQHTAVFTLTLVTIMCSTPVKSIQPTENPFHSAEPTQNAAVLSAGSVQTPRVLKLLSLCSESDQQFCLNGQCFYHPDLNRPTCRCSQNFTGERCEHMLLDTQIEENREKLIAIGGGMALLLCCITAGIYCCLKKRCEKEKPFQMCHSALAI
ncbi:hypothetical protein SKAU_G00016980 [Synaphobranchus kaupii]|uniref:methenyltetrahydrofolate cyclohydrolase n=1 Tax=Synaphobranchus kaupii TaxID=118154 RepID=A0A9Q1GCB0_SYNKA|nr:hypothetical protein SKAU_G00016980 [Synaphobranchus kaupii]